MRAKFLVALAISQTLLIGCASHNYTDAPSTLGVLYSKYAYIGYDGPILPIEDVGIVSTDGLINIQSLDGKPMAYYKAFKVSGFYYGGRYQLHLPPGVHVLTLGFHKDLGTGTISWSTSSITKTLEISKGQVIHLSLSEGGRTWSAKEFDGIDALPVIKSDFRELSSAK